MNLLLMKFLGNQLTDIFIVNLLMRNMCLLLNFYEKKLAYKANFRKANREAKLLASQPVTV